MQRVEILRTDAPKSQAQLMRLPTISGIIDRRILANFRISPEVMATALPSPFRPQIHKGWAIGGICLIRLKQIRPSFLPLRWGLTSENAAHRIAVQWESEDGSTKNGVYIPRRDTNSKLTAWAGGNVFPGIHYFAKFVVNESDDSYCIAVESNDGAANVHVSGVPTNFIPSTSIFSTINEASSFFESGSLGYSDTRIKGRYDGLELQCRDWEVTGLDITAIESSYFQDTAHFPKGSVEFDCALLMRNIVHQWHGRPDLCR